MPRARREWSALRAEIRRNLFETAPALSFWTDTLLQDLWNAAMDLRVIQMSNVEEGWVTDAFQTDLVSGQREYALPEGTGRVKRVTQVFRAGQLDEYEIPLTRWERLSEPMQQLGGASETTVFTYRLLGNLVILEPTPQSNVTSGLRIEMDFSPDRFDSDDDKLDLRFPDVLETLLVYDTVVLALAVEGAQGNFDPSRAETIRVFKGVYENAFLEYITTRSSGRVFNTPNPMGE